MSGCKRKKFYLLWCNASCSGFAQENSSGQAPGGMKERSLGEVGTPDLFIRIFENV